MKWPVNEEQFSPRSNLTVVVSAGQNNSQRQICYRQSVQDLKKHKRQPPPHIEFPSENSVESQNVLTVGKFIKTKFLSQISIASKTFPSRKEFENVSTSSNHSPSADCGE